MNGTDGLVLHHLCWADDLYAMAGSTEHLIRILTDMTNAVEDLNMRWKEKSLKIVAGPYTGSTRTDRRNREQRRQKIYLACD